MNISLPSIRYSQFSADYIKNELIERYDIGSQINCAFFRMGMNDIYLINTENKTYYLRISMADVYRQVDYEEETFIIDFLHQNKISVAYPIRCKNNQFVWSIKAPEGDRYAVLFIEAKNQPSQDQLKSLYNLGCMIAQMHLIADDNNFKISRLPIDLSQLIDKPLQIMKDHLINRPDDYDFLCVSMKKLRQFINDNLTTSKPFYGFCHGDLHLSNVNIDGNLPIIFDFDSMGYGWRAHDIAVFLFNHSLGNDKYRESNEWKSFLDGYNSVRKLEEFELKAIPAFCALRNTWVIGVHTELSKRNMGCQMISDYFNFFMNNYKLWYNRTFE
jgi:Ser/Thr protein kinase RdoA (MazF antagonist)